VSRRVFRSAETERGSAPRAPSSSAIAQEHPASPRETIPPARLIELIRNENAAAQETLVREYGRGVRKILRRRGIAECDVEDLAQEVWVTALARIRAGAVREPDKLDFFITGIARGLASNRRHKDERQRTDVNTDAVEGQEAPASSPERQARVAQYAEHVVSVLLSMNVPRDREVLARLWLGGASKEEICRSARISRKRFDGIVSRAKQRFFALLRTTDAGREMEEDDG
jgi:RNA polymerase sigma-70 factor (ECF subfamily)